MKVFVWKSHGDIRVYALTEDLKDDVLTCLSQEGVEVEEGRDYSWGEVRNLICEAKDSDSDMFESGTDIVDVRGFN